MSDSEDDLPIMELIKKRKRQAAEAAAGSRPLVAAVKREKREISAAPKPRTSSSSGGNGSSSSGAGSSGSTSTNKSTRFYESTKKGLLVQRLLVRWWFAIKWPKMEDIEQPPPGYEPLDGFPGVFISTRVDSLGKILDLRDAGKCPNLRNLSRLDCTKLKRLCVLAYETQMAELKKLEGEECRLLGILKSELSEIKNVNAAAADHEARKYSFSAEAVKPQP